MPPPFSFCPWVLKRSLIYREHNRSYFLPLLVSNFDKKLIILFKKVKIKTLLTDGGLNFPWEAILIS